MGGGEGGIVEPLIVGVTAVAFGIVGGVTACVGGACIVVAVAVGASVCGSAAGGKTGGVPVVCVGTVGVLVGGEGDALTVPDAALVLTGCDDCT